MKRASVSTSTNVDLGGVAEDAGGDHPAEVGVEADVVTGLVGRREPGQVVADAALDGVGGDDRVEDRVAGSGRLGRRAHGQLLARRRRVAAGGHQQAEPDDGQCGSDDQSSHWILPFSMRTRSSVVGGTRRPCPHGHDPTWFNDRSAWSSGPARDCRGGGQDRAWAPSRWAMHSVMRRAVGRWRNSLGPWALLPGTEHAGDHELGVGELRAEHAHERDRAALAERARRLAERGVRRVVERRRAATARTAGAFHPGAAALPR